MRAMGSLPPQSFTIAPDSRASRLRAAPTLSQVTFCQIHPIRLVCQLGAIGRSFSCFEACIKLSRRAEDNCLIIRVRLMPPIIA